MPETRYVEEYSYDSKLKAEERVLKNAKVKRISVEVSDEQLDAELEAEAREEAIKEITAKKKAELKAK